MRRIRIKQPEVFFHGSLAETLEATFICRTFTSYRQAERDRFFVSVAVGWRFDFVYLYQRRQTWGNDIQWMSIQIDYIYIYIPRTQLTSVFEDQASKIRPKLQSKQGSFEIWVLGIYIYIYEYIFKDGLVQPPPISVLCFGFTVIFVVLNSVASKPCYIIGVAKIRVWEV